MDPPGTLLIPNNPFCADPNLVIPPPRTLRCKENLAPEEEEVTESTVEENESKVLLDKVYSDQMLLSPSSSMDTEPCLICLASTLPCENEQSFPTLPGSNGNENVNLQLWSLFILRKLLKFPKRKCVEVFRKTCGASNPASWFALCASCKETTKAAMEVWQKILKLEQDFKSFPLELEKRLQESKGNVNGGIAFSQQESNFEEHIVKIRLYIRDHLIDVKRSEMFVPKIEMEAEDSSSDVSGELGEDDDTDYENDDDEEEVELSWLKNNKGVDEDPLSIPSRKIISTKTRCRQGPEILSCQLCPKKYTYKESLEKHTKLHSTSKFICHICNFPSQFELGKRVHLKKSHNIHVKKEVEKYNRSGLYHCPDCPGIYRTVRSFEEHRRHHLRKGLTYPCKVCSFPCTTILGLHQHMNKKHKDHYKCPSCPAAFAFRSLLLKHKVEHKTKFEVEPDCDSQPMNDSQQTDYDLDGMKASSENEQDNESTAADDDETSKFSLPAGKKGHNITCDQCGRRYTNSDAFNRHQKYHDRFKEFSCPKCNYPCVSASALNGHLSRKLCQRKYEYKCDQCDYETKKRYEMEAHKQQHKHVDIAVNCPEITEEITNPTVENIHKPIQEKKSFSSHKANAKHKAPQVEIEYSDKSQSFICKKCNRQYAKRRSFCNHLKKHRLNVEFECKICHYPCDSAIALEGHVLKKLCNTRGSLNKPILEGRVSKKLNNTRRSFNKKPNLGGRVSVTSKKHCSNTRSKPLNLEQSEQYTCKVCSYSTNSKDDYGLHVDTHKPSKAPKEVILQTADGKYKCSTCDQVFTTRRVLTIHKREHHPELGLFGHKCSQCPKVYTKADALKDHIDKSHLKKCNYYCEICGNGMMKKSQFENHKLKHQSVKSFICDICGSAYTYAHGLKKHLKEYHNDNKSSSSEAVTTTGRFSCKFCDETFSDRLQFNIHLKGAHQDMYVHKCDQCESTYLSVASLQLHKKISHTVAAVPAQCQFCGKQVASQVYLYPHYKMYCKKKPPGYQYSVPGVISRRKRNEATEDDDTSNDQQQQIT